jgi:hypothetical protein
VSETENENPFHTTEKEKVTCIKLLRGETPSELGLDFKDAAELLSRYKLVIRDQLDLMESNREDNPNKKLTFARVLQKTIELEQIFSEAARLTEPGSW